MAVAWNLEDFGSSCAITDSDAYLCDLLHHEPECTLILELIEEVDLILKHFSRKAAVEWPQISPFPLYFLLSFHEVICNRV